MGQGVDFWPNPFHTTFVQHRFMTDITWVNDIPMPTMLEEDYQETEYKDYEDSDWYNDPNCVMSRHHYWIMIESLRVAYVVGQVITGPNEITTNYLNEDKQIVTVIEVVQEVDTARRWC